MNESLINIPQMLMIGSTGRNSGKTTLATEAIRRWKDVHPVIGLKVTSIMHRDGTCPRGGIGCGACTSLIGDFDIIEETNPLTPKDTSQLLASGCKRVYWLKVLHKHMRQGILKLMELSGPDGLIVCESNSLRRVVKPGVFVMLDNEKSGSMKDTAKNVIAQADYIISRDIREYAADVLNNIVVDANSGKITPK